MLGCGACRRLRLLGLSRSRLPIGRTIALPVGLPGRGVSTIGLGTVPTVPTIATVSIIPTGGGTPTTTGYNGETNYVSARTLSNDGDQIGNNLVVRVNATAADQGICIDFLCTPTGMLAGDRVRAIAHVKCKNVSGSRPKFFAMYLQPTLLSIGPQFASIKSMEDGNSPCPGQFPIDTDEYLSTPFYTVSSDLNTIQFRVWFVAAGVGVNDIEVGRAMLEVRR